MLDMLILGSGLFGGWGSAPIPEPTGFWGWLWDDLKITDIAIAVFTGLLVLSNFGLWRSARNTTRTVQRAHLSIEPQGIETFGNETLAHIGIHNTGHLPARDVVWTAQIDAPYDGDRSDFEIAWKKKSGSLVVPSGTVMKFGTHAIDPTQIDMPKSEKRYCYVWGEVCYDDGFCPDRYTKYCHRYLINARTTDAKIDEKFARYHDYGNEADKVVSRWRRRPRLLLDRARAAISWKR
jgi:hypothetical protein